MSNQNLDLNDLNNILQQMEKVSAAKDAIVMLNDATDLVIGALSFPGVPKERQEELITDFANALGRLGQEITAAIGHRMPDVEVVEGIEIAKIRMHEKLDEFIKEQESYQPPEVLVVDLSGGFKQNVKGN